MSSQPVTSTPPLIPHNQAVNRFRFIGTIKIENDLHIGSGRGDEKTDSLFVMSNGKPIIPGSSFRGVFRSQIERLLQGLNESGVRSDLWACQLYEPDLKGKICVGNLVNSDSHKKYDEFVELQKTSGSTAVWNELHQYLCTACRTFGAGTFWASKIRIPDLHLKAQSPYKPSIRHGVGIHRDTGTAAPGVKYDREVLESGAEFELEIIAENLDATDKLLLALGFQQLFAGELALGGGTNRGTGKVTLTKDGNWATWVSFDKKDDESKKALVDYLTTGVFPKKKNLFNWVADRLGKAFPESGANHAEDTH